MSRLLLTADAVGGVWQYSLELARALAPLGWRTTIALLGPAAAPRRKAEAEAAGARLIETGLPLDWLAEDEGRVRDAGLAVAALARDIQADIVQLNQPAFAAVPFDRPVIAAVHSCLETWWRAVEGGPAPADFAWRTALVAEGLAAATRVVCPSAAFGAAVAEAYGLARPPATIHNGRSPLPAVPGALHDFAFTAGRLWDRGKNVAVLDRAAARLGVPVKAAGPLAGPNGERIAPEHLACLGPLSDEGLAACLAARPVFASAARYEPFGLAVLEAANAGCPLVLSDIPSFRELWDGVATFVPADDAPGFAAAIEELVIDTRLRLTRGDLARRRAARFTPAAMAAGMDALYRPLLGRAAA